MSWEVVGQRLSGLLRTRVLLSAAGLVMLYVKPEIGQWVVILVGMALGVSAIDAVKGLKNGTDAGNSK